MAQPYDYTIKAPNPADAFIGAYDTATKMQSRKVDTEAKREELSILQDKTRSLKMYENVNQFAHLPYEQRQEALSQFVAEQEAQGNDMKHSRKFLSMGAEEQALAHTGMKQNFEARGWLKPTAAATKDFYTVTGPDGTPQVQRLSQAELNAMPAGSVIPYKADTGGDRESRAIAREERREDRAISREERKAEADISREEKKARIKSNENRLNKLGEAAASRKSGINKAKKFLSLIESGEFDTGTFEAVASYMPGKWGKQGQWHEEMDAFAETAARAELKSLGEIRPTDADVKGMKEAIFGPGRDEETNKILLREYIEKQTSNSKEYTGLVRAKKAGKLSTYQSEPTLAQDVVRMKDADGNEYDIPEAEVEQARTQGLF